MKLTTEQILLQGATAHKEGRLDDAERLYRSILDIQPRHPKGNHNLGVLTLAVGRGLEALSFFRTALEASPSTTQLWLSYIDALIKLGKFVEAKTVLNKAREKGAKDEGFDKLEERLKESTLSVDMAVKNPEPPQDQLRPIMDFHNQGDLQQALETAVVLLRRFPDSVVLHNFCGIAYKGLGQFEEAISFYEKAINLKADLADPYYNMANCLKELGSLEEAIEAYKKTLDLKPDYTKAIINMAHAIKDQGKLEEAIVAYKKAIVLEPDNVNTFIDLGVALQDSGSLEAALKTYKEAIVLDFESARAHNNLGVVLQEKGNLQEAIEAYKQAIALEPDNAEVYNNMGVAFGAQGKFNEAIDAQNQAIALKPNYSAASFSLATLFYRTRQFEKAVQLFKGDSSASSQTYVLKCLYELGEKTKFIEQLNYLVNRNENNATIGSYISRSQLKYRLDIPNPFCNEPLEHALKIDLKQNCDFEDIFVKEVNDILNCSTVQNMSQPLLTNGTQTSGNVFSQLRGKTEKIENILRREIGNYRERFSESKEGFIQAWPADYELYGWIISMKSGGKLDPHMHQKGWLSGSIYINVPPNLEEDAGNFVVCMGEGNSDPRHDKNSKVLEVTTGSLCLFPSSLLHYTVPFQANTDRLVLAFDMIPR